MVATYVLGLGDGGLCRGEEAACLGCGAFGGCCVLGLRRCGLCGGATSVLWLGYCGRLGRGSRGCRVLGYFRSLAGL